MTAQERPGPQITDEDVQWALLTVGAAVEKARPRGLTGADKVHAHLESTLRPGGLVARAIADELDRLVDEQIRPHIVWLDQHQQDRADRARMVGATEVGDMVRKLAAEWREGKR